jgi:hypothetical protein
VPIIVPGDGRDPVTLFEAEPTERVRKLPRACDRLSPVTDTISRSPWKLAACSAIEEIRSGVSIIKPFMQGFLFLAERIWMWPSI